MSLWIYIPSVIVGAILWVNIFDKISYKWGADSWPEIICVMGGLLNLVVSVGGCSVLIFDIQDSDKITTIFWCQLISLLIVILMAYTSDIYRGLGAAIRALSKLV